jgi:hypothetical protein
MASAMSATGFTVGVHFQFVHPDRAKCVDTGIAPDVAPRPTVLSKFEGVDVRRVASLVNENKFVLAAIEVALSWRGLRPNAKVFQFIEDSGASH